MILNLGEKKGRNYVLTLARGDVSQSYFIRFKTFISIYQI